MDWDARFKETIESGESWFGYAPSPAVVKAINVMIENGSEVLETGSHAVDVGAGEGRHARELADLGYRVTALEISQVAVDHFKERFEKDGYDNVEWVCSDYENWVPDEPVDVVLAAFFHHNEGGMAEALPKFDAWTRPGGWMLLAGHSRSQSGPNAKGPDNPDLLWDLDEITGFLKDSGYEIIFGENVDRELPGDPDHPNQFAPAVDTIVVARKPVEQ